MKWLTMKRVSQILSLLAAILGTIAMVGLFDNSLGEYAQSMTIIVSAGLISLAIVSRE